MTKIARNFIEGGYRRLGAMLKAIMDARAISYGKLVTMFEEIGFSTNQPMIQRIRRGSSEPAADFLLALARLELLRDEKGYPLTVENLIDICTGEYRVDQSEIGGDTFPDVLRYGINLFVPTDITTSLEQFSVNTGISVGRLNELLDGATPTRLEIIEIARIVPNPKTGRFFETLDLALMAGGVIQQTNVIPMSLSDIEQRDRLLATEAGPSDEQLKKARATRKKQEQNPTPAKKIPPKPGRTRRNAPTAKKKNGGTV